MAAPCPHRVTRGPRIRSESQTWPCHRSMSQCRFLGPFPKSWLSGPGRGPGMSILNVLPWGRTPRPVQAPSHGLSPFGRVAGCHSLVDSDPPFSPSRRSGSPRSGVRQTRRRLSRRPLAGWQTTLTVPSRGGRRQGAPGLFMRPPTTQSPWGPTSPVTLGGKSKQTWGDTNPHGC